jgi:hypothetical protein
VSQSYFAMLLAIPGEATPVVFEGLTAKLIKVTIAVAGPGSPVDFDLWDRSSGESLLLDHHEGAVAGDKVFYTLSGCKSFKLTAQSRDPHEMWCDVAVQVDYLLDPTAPEPKPLKAPTRHRRYPTKSHRRTWQPGAPLSQPKLADTLGADVAAMLNLPVAAKVRVTKDVALVLAAARLERQAQAPQPTVLQPVIVKEPLTRRVHRIKHDQHGEITEIEEVQIPIQEAAHGDN